MLAARGVALTDESFAGALLEAERDAWLKNAAEGWIRLTNEQAKQARRRRR